MVKLHVSSSIADLERERRTVLDRLRLARHQPVDRYFPDGHTMRDSCLDDVGACELYDAILGITFPRPAHQQWMHVHRRDMA